MAHLLVAQVVDTLPFQQDLARGHPAWRLEQADDGRTRKRFSGAGFTDHAEDFARRDFEADVVDRAQGAVSTRKLDDEIVDLKQTHGGEVIGY